MLFRMLKILIFKKHILWFPLKLWFPRNMLLSFTTDKNILRVDKNHFFRTKLTLWNISGYLYTVSLFLLSRKFSNKEFDVCWKCGAPKEVVFSWLPSVIILSNPRRKTFQKFIRKQFANLFIFKTSQHLYVRTNSASIDAT